MPELLDESSNLESTTVGVYRTAATVKGGRRFSFSALVVVGDRRGKVGLGYSKANQVPQAIEKAQKEAKRKMKGYTLQALTLPHTLEGRFGACIVRLVPASPGTGVIAGAAVRAVLEMAGVQDCLSKCYGSTNPKNLVKATLDALDQAKSRQTIEALRGVTIPPTSVEESIERGRAFMPVTRSSEKAAAPKNTVSDGRGGPGGRRGGPRRPRGGDRDGGSSSGGGSAGPSTATAS